MRYNGDPALRTPRFRGDDINYIGAHGRVYKARGKATEHACHWCGAPAHQWAYDHADPNEKRPDAPRSRCSDLSAMAPSSP